MGSLECSVCHNDFDIETFLPLVGSCGHSVCCLCVLKLDNTKCPLCQRAEAFRHATNNYQLIDLLKSIQNHRRIDQSERADRESTINALQGELDETKRKLLEAEKKLAKRKTAVEASVMECTEEMQRMETGTPVPKVVDMIVRARMLLRNKKATPNQCLSMADDLEYEILLKSKLSHAEPASHQNSDELVSKLRARAEDEAKIEILATELNNSIESYKEAFSNFFDQVDVSQPDFCLKVENNLGMGEIGLLFDKIYDHSRAIRFQERMDEINQIAGNHVSTNLVNSLMEKLKTNYFDWYKALEGEVDMVLFLLLLRRHTLAAQDGECLFWCPIYINPGCCQVPAAGSVSHRAIVNWGPRRLVLKIIIVDGKMYEVNLKYGIVNPGASIPITITTYEGPPEKRGPTPSIHVLYATVSEEASDAEYEYCTRTPEGCFADMLFLY